MSSSTPTSSPPPNPDPQHTFLIHVLQAIAVSNGDPLVVYPLLKATPDKLDDNFAQVLRNWVADTLPNMESLADVENLVKLIGYFSNLIQQFPLGNRARNLEIAIAGYKIVATVVTCEASPELWATLQICLGAAYTNRILGERADNLEQAINCYHQVLLVLTREAFPEKWADTQNNLGAAYLYRILGERADNLEQAITCLNQALLVRTREAFPEKWADTQINLGFTYLYRILGERADNLEQAITCLNQALLVRTREAFPEKWADTQINLGGAYFYRILGERADNLEQAINCYHQALLVLTREAFPEKWADIQNNLGFIYSNRILWKRANNLEQAITYLNQALLVRTREAFPEKWADTQNNLGGAYFYRILGERADNLEQAINCYHQALLVLTRVAFPEKWADIQINLGLAYINLGGIRGDRAGANLRASAIRFYTEALQFLTRETFPQNYAETKFNLGVAYQEDNQLQLAHDIFADAIDTVESMRGDIASGNEAKQKLAEYWNELYRRMVEVCLTLGNPIKAIEYVERSKARNLVELLTDRDRYPKGATQQICAQLDQLRRDIIAEQQRLDIGKRIEKTNPSSLVVVQGFIEVFPQEIRPHLSSSFAPLILDRTRLNELQQQLEQLIKDTIQPIDPSFKFTQKVDPIPFSDIQALIDDSTAMIEWYITDNKILTFIITRQSPGITVWQSAPSDLQALIAWKDKYLLDLTQNRSHWQKQLPDRLKILAKILHLDHILTLVPNTCDRLILIPHRFIHLFPLHALPLSEGTYLLDHDRCRAGVRYAPSCQLLQLTQKQNRSDFKRLFAIQDPEQNLPFANSVVETIRDYFQPDAQVLVREAATKEALKNPANAEYLRSAHCVLFSCHGKYVFKSPLQSCLKLANDTRLTLGEIFSLTLSQCSLVTLSACETGFTDPRSVSDEYIGLPSGFLFAGSPTVLSSLWEVSSISTTLLVRKFYQYLFENLRTHQKLKMGDVAIALNKAQQWLRQLPSEQCETILRDELQPQIDKILAQLPKGKQYKFNKSVEAVQRHIRDCQPHPFASPYYWAAFTAIGF